MSFGTNVDINKDSKVGIRHNLGVTKKNPDKPKPSEVKKEESKNNVEEIVPTKPPIAPYTTSHERNLMSIVVLGAGVTWLLFR